MTASEQLSALERMSVDARENGKTMLLADLQRMAELREVVRLEVRNAARAKEGAK